MFHSMLGYAEVYTDISSIQICALRFEPRAGIDIEKNNYFDKLFINDAADITTMISNERKKIIYSRVEKSYQYQSTYFERYPAIINFSL